MSKIFPIIIYVVIFGASNNGLALNDSTSDSRFKILHKHEALLESFLPTQGETNEGFSVCGQMAVYQTNIFKQAVPYNMVQHCNDTGEINTFRMWLILKGHADGKYLYRNYTARKISPIVNVSHTAIRTHVKRMIELGWCYMSGNNLCFTGTNKLVKMYSNLSKEWFAGRLIMLPITKDKKQLLKEIRHLIVIRNHDAQKAIVAKRERLVNMSNPNYSQCLAQASISVFTFGKLFKRSRSTGMKIKKEMKDAGKLSSTHRQEIVAVNIPKLDFFSNATYQKGSYFFTNGCVIKVKSDIIDIKRNWNIPVIPLQSFTNNYSYLNTAWATH